MSYLKVMGVIYQIFKPRSKSLNILKQFLNNFLTIFNLNNQQNYAKPPSWSRMANPKEGESTSERVRQRATCLAIGGEKKEHPLKIRHINRKKTAPQTGSLFPTSSTMNCSMCVLRPRLYMFLREHLKGAQEIKRTDKNSFAPGLKVTLPLSDHRICRAVWGSCSGTLPLWRTLACLPGMPWCWWEVPGEINKWAQVRAPSAEQWTFSYSEIFYQYCLKRRLIDVKRRRRRSSSSRQRK